MDSDYKYFVVFTLNLANDKGREIAKRKDIIDKNIRADIPFIQGFRTKICMKIWVEDNIEAFDTYFMLKPIS